MIDKLYSVQMKCFKSHREQNKNKNKSGEGYEEVEVSNPIGNKIKIY